MATINDDKLLQLVSYFRPIYNESSPDYKSILKKESFWQTIAEYLGVEVPIAKARFKSLCEKYRRKSAIAKHIKPSNALDKRKPEFPLMSLFKSIMESRKKIKIKIASNNIIEETDTFEPECIKHFLGHSCKLEDIEESETTNGKLLQIDSEQPNTSSSIGSRRREMKRRISCNFEDGNVPQNISLVNKNKNKKLDAFCNYLLAELEEFPPNIVNFAMDKIMKLILDYKQKIRSELL